ncbi:hypothetical protein C8Q75DRAFT_501801 [Abortiporus biennis]|nr:hypothetical protein C8Q75DRAFT_501801 [Abortiporus biennis]
MLSRKPYIMSMGQSNTTIFNHLFSMSRHPHGRLMQHTNDNYPQYRRWMPKKIVPIYLELQFPEDDSNVHKVQVEGLAEEVQQALDDGWKPLELNLRKVFESVDNSDGREGGALAMFLFNNFVLGSFHPKEVLKGLVVLAKINPGDSQLSLKFGDDTREDGSWVGWKPFELKGNSCLNFFFIPHETRAFHIRDDDIAPYEKKLTYEDFANLSSYEGAFFAISSLISRNLFSPTEDDAPLVENVDTGTHSSLSEESDDGNAIPHRQLDRSTTLSSLEAEDDDEAGDNFLLGRLLSSTDRAREDSRPLLDSISYLKLEQLS